MQMYSGVFDCGIVDERVVDTMREALECFELRTDESTVMYQAGKIFTGSPGRSKYNISREQLEFLIHKRFSVDDIALLLGVGKCREAFRGIQFVGKGNVH